MTMAASLSLMNMLWPAIWRQQALLLDVARAGSRLVAVGEFGHVLIV